MWVFGYVCFGICQNERWEYLDHFQACYQEHHYVNFHLVDICSIVTFVLNWNLWIITINFGATLCYSIIPFHFVWVMVMLLTKLWKTHLSPLTFQMKLVLIFWSKWEQGLDSWIFWSAITTSLGKKILRNLLCLLKVFWCN